MTTKQCPCADLFKIGDDYTREHHPDCGIAQAEKFGQLVEQGKEHLRERLSQAISPELTKEIPPFLERLDALLAAEPSQGVAPVPDYHVTPGAIESISLAPTTGISNFVTIEGQCDTCGQPFIAPGCTLNTSSNPQTVTGLVYCLTCEDMYVFYAEGEFA